LHPKHRRPAARLTDEERAEARAAVEDLLANVARTHGSEKAGAPGRIDKAST